MKIILLLFLSLNIYSQTDSMEVNFGKHILPNGKFAINEWDDAAEIKADDKIILLSKQDDDYFYLGIKFINESHTGIDLYLADSDQKMKMLHVSSALGEKEFVDAQWSEFIWSENDLWTGNSIGMISVDGKSEFLENEGFEFQIHKSIIESNDWLLMIHLKRPEIVFPINAKNKNTTKWLRMNFK